MISGNYLNKKTITIPNMKTNLTVNCFLPHIDSILFHQTNAAYFTHENNIVFMFNYLPCLFLFLDILDLITSLV